MTLGPSYSHWWILLETKRQSSIQTQMVVYDVPVIRDRAFGNAKYYDLQIWCKDEKGYLDLCYGFRRPESVDKNKYFTGSNGFEITDLEVYEIMF